MSEWQPIESVPKSRAVLVYYKNSAGKGRTIKARFVPRFTQESSGEVSEDCDEYLEGKDTYYLLEGWYEQIDNWDDYAEVFVHKTPSHWMPLPSSPTEP